MSKTILVVDDERALADTMREILEQVGYRALAAYDAEQAAEALAANQVDLLISDVVMPGRNGFELALETSRRYPRTMVLLISGNATTQQLVGELNQGNRFQLLAKPILPRQMLAQVAAMLAEKS